MIRLLSICLHVSIATPTTINTPVPPIDTDVGSPVFIKLLNTIGSPAINAINVEPKKVILFKILVIYFSLNVRK